MRNSILIAVMVLISQRLAAQSVFVSTEFKKGIYKDFNEFITNNPSISLDEEIWIEEDAKDLLDNYTMTFFGYKGNRIELPIFRLKKKERNTGIDTKDFWGYCDGSKFFINSYTHIPRNYFVQLLLVGRYCYFIQMDPSGNTGPTNSTVERRDENGVAEYIINVNNGKIFKLDAKLLRVILQDDDDLLKEFNADKELKNKLLIDYIEKYNVGHADEIKMLK